MSDASPGRRPAGDGVKVPFVFVPEGASVPDAVRGPDWVRIPATFVPRGGERLTPSGQPWPRDRSGREWPKDRLGRPICPLWDPSPGVRAPGEAAPDGGDPIAAFNEPDAVFRDPARAAGLVQPAAGGGTDGRLTAPPLGDTADSHATAAPPAPFNPEGNDVGNLPGNGPPPQFGPPAPSETLKGIASTYDLPGQRMSNGQMFDRSAMSAAMLHVKMGTVVTVTLASDPNRSVTVKITDRGPFIRGRIIDLTPAAFTALVGSTAPGLAQVVVTVP
jgi:hypothetical protein